ESKIPPDVRAAQWLSTATPEQKAAFMQMTSLKAGLPPGMGLTPNDTTAQGADYLKTLPENERTMIQGMIDGRIMPPSSFAIQKPYWQKLISDASRVDPKFDQTTWAGRVATRRDFASGQAAKNLTAINTALMHAGVLSQAFDKLNNGEFPSWNAAVNWMQKEGGNPNYSNAREAVDALASESRKVFAQTGGGGLTELENWERNFPLNGSPEQQKGALKQLVQLYDSRIDALGEQYSRGMGRTEDGLALLSPKGKLAYEQLTGQEPTSNKVMGEEGQATNENKAAPAQAAPAIIPPRPGGVPLGAQYSPSQKIWWWKDSAGHWANNSNAQ
ncbi:MAG: hypothetical protein KGL39_04070, partial [Patescibacteria group bacterium]|nr:hypothetical protein [Patescibacteria group bacterium]